MFIFLLITMVLLNNDTLFLCDFRIYGLAYGWGFLIRFWIVWWLIDYFVFLALTIFTISLISFWFAELIIEFLFNVCN